MSLYEVTLVVAQDEDYSNTLGYATQSPTGNLQLATPYNFNGVSYACLRVTPTDEPDEETAIISLYGPAVDTTTTGIYFPPTPPYPVVNGVSIGPVVLTILNADTINLPAGNWVYDMLITMSDKNTFYASGNFIVVETRAR